MLYAFYPSQLKMVATKSDPKVISTHFYQCEALFLKKRYN